MPPRLAKRSTSGPNVGQLTRDLPGQDVARPNRIYLRKDHLSKVISIRLLLQKGSTFAHAGPYKVVKNGILSQERRQPFTRRPFIAPRRGQYEEQFKSPTCRLYVQLDL